jgi:hypothetical protein
VLEFDKKNLLGLIYAVISLPHKVCWPRIM